MTSYFNKKNLSWGFGEKIWRIMLDAITLVLFAKMLGPEVLGQHALLLILIMLSAVLVEAGTPDAIIREKENKKFESTIFWFNGLIGVLYILILYSTSQQVSVFFNYPDYAEKIIYLLPIVFMNSLLVVPIARLKRDGEFHVISKRNIGAGVIGKFFGVGMAYTGFGLLSLITMSVLTKAAELALVFLFTKWRPGFELDLKSLKRNLKFVIYLSASKLINYFAKRIGIIVMAQYFGPVAVGLYDLAYKLMTYVLRLVHGVLLTIFYSDIVSEPKSRLAERHANMSTIMAILFYPIIAFFILHSNEILIQLFGKEWENASGILIILFITLRILAQSGIASQILKSMGFSHNIFNAVLISSLAMVLTSYFVASLGRMEYVAISYLLSILILMSILYHFLNRYLTIGYLSLLKPEVLVIAIMIFSSLTLLAIQHYIIELSELFTLIISAVIFVSIYVLFIYLGYREGFYKVTNLFKIPK